MKEKIICGKCPAVYDLDEIEAYEGDDLVGTAADIKIRSGNGGGAPSKLRKFGLAALGLSPVEKSVRYPNFAAIDQLRPRTYLCPEGHRVDGSPGEQFPFAVIGATASTKSHVLPGIVRELYEMRALAGLGVKLTGSLYTDPTIKKNIDQLYGRGGALPPTPRGELQGPFSYRLEVGPNEKRYSLMLFDIAGEDLQSVVMIADRARYIAVCRALLVLIDPAGFLPSQFDTGLPIRTESMRIDATHNVREGIRAFADVLTQVWEVESSKQLDIPVCFAVAKADAVDWPEWYQWDTQTASVIGAAGDLANLGGALASSSSETREALLELGGKLVVEEIEDLFAADRIRFSALSATSAMPAPNATGDQLAWEQPPRPQGIGLSVLQLLDLAGMAAPAADTAEV
ncbi:MAG: hypothetical protein WBV85_11840 [Solirubrobacteraceae bacterium]